MIQLSTKTHAITFRPAPRRRSLNDIRERREAEQFWRRWYGPDGVVSVWLLCALNHRNRRRVFPS